MIARVALDAGSAIRLPVEPALTAGVCVVAREVDLGGRPELEVGATAVFANDGEAMMISSDHGGKRG
ncbi:MAG: hypothetical protein OEV40_06720 [Acidimicrobiia bacterium]|nr:hypothetical protein [Acidimicrobiia bacterium]